jgi:hypothetical protein
MGLVKLIVFGFLGLSVVYLSISIYSRSVRREKLEKHWDADPPEGADAAARDAYINEGMARYQSGLRRKLIALVYIIPTVIIAVILYVTNAN